MMGGGREGNEGGGTRGMRIEDRGEGAKGSE